ncbi:MAG TPA: tRNA glutamyl-Q(34) synthetase GluQRS [Methylotenera sp.]|nr:tRNA glutamyl-Q(34) synthetase GluQRS [Methylotenera sp.]
MYIGRFAPSPTGPLHFGSLIAALASYAEARKQHGRWLVRMEDLDKPREIAGAADHILKTLSAFGFEWDTDVIYQSERSSYYQAAFDELLSKGYIYPCSCSRKEIADSASIGIEGAIYPGTCLAHPTKLGSKVAWRVKTNHQPLVFSDAIQTSQNGNVLKQNLAKDIGDFVLKRSDGYFAYQLAVVVDDNSQGITHIVRGADLLSSTPRQIYLQHLLNFKQPHYAHVPIAVNAEGEKLSKQTLAEAIEPTNAVNWLIKALLFLGQKPPTTLQKNSINEVWEWVFENWDLQKIPAVFKLPAS